MLHSRVLSRTTSSILRRALLPGSSLIHTQICSLFTLTAFEKAKQELHGERWKETLNCDQREFIRFKEKVREQRAQFLQEKLGDKWEAAVANETAECYASRDYQDKVLRIKQKLSNEEVKVKAT